MLSEHLRRLRAAVGTDLLLLPAVVVGIIDDDDRVLLVRHADSRRWGLVGGAVDVDERPEDAAVREAAEETGIEVSVSRVVTALGGPQSRVSYPNGDETAYVSVIYEATPVGGDPRPDGDETTELGWFSRPDLRTPELGSFAAAAFREIGWFDQRE